MVLVLALGCCAGSGSGGDAAGASSADAGSARTSGETRPRHARPAAQPEAEPADPPPPPIKAGAMISINKGAVLAGSTPDTPGRTSEVEMDGEEVEVPAFEIDALPYPNDPGRPPLTGVTHEKAAALCRDQGKRLCHELEWELACESPRGRTYPYGNRYDPDRYDRPVNLASKAGVRAMGTVGEWTLAAFEPDDEGIAVRGPADQEGGAATRRCAHRRKLAPSTESEALGFRCCRGGAPEGLAYRTPTKVGPWDRLDRLTELEAFQALVRSVPELEEVHDDPRPFTQEDMFHVRHISEVPSEAIPQLTWKVLGWVPHVGEELLVLAGRDGRDTFVAVLYKLPGDRVRHAASYVLLGVDDPIMLGYTSNPRHVQWLPCVGCRDGGVITIEDGRVDISQRW